MVVVGQVSFSAFFWIERHHEAMCEAMWVSLRAIVCSHFKVFDCIDFNGSGSIEYSEFLVGALNREKLCRTTSLQRAFRAFDRDGSGSITSSDIMDMLGLQESALDIYVSENILKGEGGGVDYEAFVNHLRNATVSPVTKQ